MDSVSAVTLETASRQRHLWTYGVVSRWAPHPLSAQGAPLGTQAVQLLIHGSERAAAMSRARHALTSVLGRHECRSTSAPAAALYVPTRADRLALRSAVRAWGVPHFRNWPLLLRALTSAQVATWAAVRLAVPPASVSPSQLEFLGDRAVSAALVAEGKSGVERMVGNSGFMLAAKRAGMDKLLRCSTYCSGSPATLSNAYEAVAGVVYVDGGIPAVRSFVATTLIPHEADVREVNKDLNKLRLELSAAVKATQGPCVHLKREEYGILGDVVIKEMEGGGPKMYGHRLTLCKRPLRGVDTVDNVAGHGTLLAEFQATTRRGAEAGAIEVALKNLGRHIHADLSYVPSNFGDQSTWSNAGLQGAKSVTQDSENGFVNVLHVDRCLRASNAATTSSISGATISATLQTWWVHSTSSGNPMQLQAALSEAAEVGYRVFQLCITEEVFRAAPDAPLSELHARADLIRHKRLELAHCMGGDSASGVVKSLVTKLSGRLMLYVALGVVTRMHGFEAALMWVEGGRNVLSIRKAC